MLQLRIDIQQIIKFCIDWKGNSQSYETRLKEESASEVLQLIKDRDKEMLDAIEEKMKSQNRVAGLPAETCTTFDIFGAEAWKELRREWEL